MVGANQARGKPQPCHLRMSAAEDTTEGGFIYNYMYMYHLPSNTEIKELSPDHIVSMLISSLRRPDQAWKHRELS